MPRSPLAGQIVCEKLCHASEVSGETAALALKYPDKCQCSVKQQEIPLVFHLFQKEFRIVGILDLQLVIGVPPRQDGDTAIITKCSQR